MPGLTIHAGGRPATIEDLNAVRLPLPTNTHAPVQHGDFVRMVLHDIQQRQLHGRPVKVVQQTFGLTNNNARMFGILELEDVRPEQDYFPLIGLYNFNDRRMGLGLAAGISSQHSNSAAFIRSPQLQRRYNTETPHELPERLARALAEVFMIQDNLEQTILRFKKYVLPGWAADQLFLQLYRQETISAQRMAVAIGFWDEPPHEALQDRSAWVFFNAVLSSLAGLAVPDLAERTQDLEDLLLKAMNSLEQDGQLEEPPKLEAPMVKYKYTMEAPVGWRMPTRNMDVWGQPTGVATGRVARAAEPAPQPVEAPQPAEDRERVRGTRNIFLDLEGATARPAPAPAPAAGDPWWMQPRGRRPVPVPGVMPVAARQPGDRPATVEELLAPVPAQVFAELDERIEAELAADEPVEDEEYDDDEDAENFDDEDDDQDDQEEEEFYDDNDDDDEDEEEEEETEGENA